MKKEQNRLSLLPSSISSMFPEIKEQKTQKFTALILTLIAFSVFGVFAISPTLSTVTELQKKIEDSKFVLGNLTTKITNLTTLHREYQDLQNDLPSLFSAVPKTANVPELVGQLQKVAADNHITINSLQVSEVELTAGQGGVTPLHSFSFVLDTDGKRDDVMQFLSDVTSFQRIIVINDLSLRRNSIIQGHLVASMKGKAYFTP